ncbi:MAG: hypothetical protein OXC38_02340 [Gammaproteobacteria bacterium]|nr:hypothetical protein [Gammaproteobacteria bacterium]
MSAPSPLSALARQREQIQQALLRLGNFRQGSLASQYRKCGKPGCHCARDGDPGHGPHWVVTRTVDGKTRSQAIPKSAVGVTRTQLTRYQKFRDLMRQWTEVDSRICEERLKHGEPETPEKRGLSSQRSTARSRRS